MSARRLLVLAVAVAALLPVAAVAAEPPAYEEHLARIGRSVLPVRAYLKVRAAFGGQTMEMEEETETAGVVADPTGLIVLSNTALGGESSPLFQALKSRMPGLELQVDVTRLVVLVGPGLEEREASLLVRDGQRDLAWIEVQGARERPLDAVDLATGVEPVVGQRLICVRRMARGFDYAPELVRAYVTSRLPRPRLLYGLKGDLAGVESIGQVLFDLAGRPVGVTVLQAGVGGEADGLRAALLPVGALRQSLAAAVAMRKP
jgi:hypothetical protein